MLTVAQDSVSSYIDSFEKLRRIAPTDIKKYLPPRDHSVYLTTLMEIVRVDMEYGWADGLKPRLDDYLKKYPELKSDSSTLSNVAFEEYRLRSQSGELVNAEEYAKKYGIDVAEWQVEPLTSNLLMLQTLVTNPDDIANAAVQFIDWQRSQSNDNDLAQAIDAHTQPSPVLQKFKAISRTAPAAATKLAEAVTAFPRVGATFLGFRLISELGRGAFARVFLAEQEELAGRKVALKITPNVTGEAKVLAQLQHTNIMPVYSVHYSDFHQAICMPYFGATTLADLIAMLSRSSGARPISGVAIVSTVRLRNTHKSTEKQQPSGTGDSSTKVTIHTELARPTSTLDRYSDMSLTEAILWIVERLAECLAHAHERGKLHRDIKPANVLLADDGQPMLLDFNLAADADSNAGFGGTLAYMAPEHLEAFSHRSARPDERSDIYSLGMILFELLAGQAAFQCNSTDSVSLIETLIHLRKQGPPSLRKLNRDVTPAVEAIVNKCLAPDPNLRYQRAADLREDLECHARNLPLRYAANPSVVERFQKWSRRHPRLTSSTAVAVLALCVIITVTSTALAFRESNRVLAARQNYRDWQLELADVRAALYRRDPTQTELNQGLTRGRQSLNRIGVLTTPDWENQPLVRYLPATEREKMRDDAGELLFLLAKGNTHLAERAKPAERAALLSESLELNSRAYEVNGRVKRALSLQKAEILRLKNDPNADELARHAESMPASSARDQYLLGHAQSSRGEYDRALVALIDATRRDPESFSAWFVRGQCHFARMQYDQAAECFSACIALRPDDAHAWQNRGVTAFQRQRGQDALQDLNRAVTLAPHDSDLRIDRAAVNTALGKHTEAIVDLDTALELGTTRTRVYFMRAVIRERAGDHKGGKQDRELGRTHIPSDEGSWIARAEDAISTSQAAALASVDEALKINPSSSVALQFRAHLLTELHRVAEAEQALDRAIKLYPDHAPFWCGRGVHHARLGHREQAIADAREALARDTSPSNLYQAGCVFALTSKTNPEDRLEALRLVRTAIASGFGFEYLASDTDLDPIRKTAEFAAIQKLAAQIQPKAARK